MLQWFSNLLGKALIASDTNPIPITIIGVSPGTGDVVGPASSVDNTLARFDGASGKLLQGGGPTVDDSGNMEMTGQLAIGRPVLGTGMAVIEGTLTNVDNADGVVVTTKTIANTDGDNAMFGFSSQTTSQTVPFGVSDTGGRTAVTGDAYANGANFAGTLGRQIGVRGQVGAVGLATGTITAAYGGYFGIRNEAAGATITTAVGVYIENSGVTGTITNRFDIYAASPNAKSYFAGKLGVKVLSPTRDFEVGGTAGINSTTDITYGTPNTGGLSVLGGASFDKAVQIGIGSENSYTAIVGGNGGTFFTAIGGGLESKIQGISSAGFGAADLKLNPIGGTVITGADFRVTGVGLFLPNIPTSPVGLVAGQVWRNLSILTIV